MKEDTCFKFYHYIELDEILKKGTDKGIENIVGYVSFLLLMYLKEDFMNIGVVVLPIAIAFLIYRLILRVLTLHTNIKIYYPKVENLNLFCKIYGSILKITTIITIFFFISVGIAIYSESFQYVLNNIHINNIYINAALVLMTFYIFRVHLLKRYITSREYCELAKKVKSGISFNISKVELNKRIMHLKQNQENYGNEQPKYVDVTPKIHKKESYKKQETKPQMLIDTEIRRKARNVNIDIDVD